MSIDAVSRPDAMRDDEFGFTIQSEPNHCAAPLVGVALVQIRFAGVDVTPHFVASMRLRHSMLSPDSRSRSASPVIVRRRERTRPSIRSCSFRMDSNSAAAVS